MSKLDKFINNKYAKYYYTFDFIMHDFMIQEFKKYFNSNNCLELGAGNGNFTKKLLKNFDSVTVIEGSKKSINQIKKIKSSKLTIVNQDLDNINLNKKFNNIFLIHTYEHLKFRIKFLKKIKQNLKKNGKLFLVCPNANAISRKIAVKMKLIETETSVTKSEKAHGHYVTHNLRSLKTEVKKSGFKIKKSGGLLFKPLANFQLDMALKKNIIDKKYLRGCFELGKQYPEFCSSIYLVLKV